MRNNAWTLVLDLYDVLSSNLVGKQNAQQSHIAAWSYDDRIFNDCAMALNYVCYTFDLLSQSCILNLNIDLPSHHIDPSTVPIAFGPQYPSKSYQHVTKESDKNNTFYL